MNGPLRAGAAPRGTTPENSLAGQTVVITGGGRGLGAAIGAELGALGARIAVVDIHGTSADACASRLAASGIAARAFAVDVGDETQVSRLIVDVCEAFEHVDVVVNCAAIDLAAPLGDISAHDWRRVLRTNLTGPFLVSRQAVIAMLARWKDNPDVPVRGQVVNIATTAARRAWPNAAAYHASEWGLLGLSHAMHAELRPQGIKVSAIVTGAMRTPFLLDRCPDGDAQAQQDPAQVANAVRFVLTQPADTVIPEVMVLPMHETSWP